MEVLEFFYKWNGNGFFDVFFRKNCGLLFFLIDKFCYLGFLVLFINNVIVKIE